MILNLSGSVLEFAGLVPTISTLKYFVGTFPESFGMLCVKDLPPDENDDRCEEKAPGEEILDEQHWCEHHEVAPVINAAVYAAFVFHDLRSEGAEKEYAYVIAKEIETRKQKEFSFANNTEKVHKRPYAVHYKPDEHDGPCGLILFLNIFQQVELRIVFDRDV